MNFVPYKLIFHISGLSRNKISDIYTNLIVLIYWKNINSLSLGGNTNIVKIEESKFIKRKKTKGIMLVVYGFLAVFKGIHFFLHSSW